MSQAEKTIKNVGKNLSPEDTTEIFTSLVGALIARLGIELTETHDRLAKVERAIKDLQLSK